MSPAPFIALSQNQTGSRQEKKREDRERERKERSPAEVFQTGRRAALKWLDISKMWGLLCPQAPIRRVP